MHDIYRTLAITLVALCGFAACGAAADHEPPPVVTTTVATDHEREDEKADRPLHWTVKADDLQMWMYTTLQPDWAEEGTTWRLRGEVNVEIETFRAYDERGRAFAAHMTGPRTFAVDFGPDRIVDVIAGARIYFDFFPRDAAPAIFHGTTRFAPRFTRWAGTRRLYVYRAINPVYSGNQLRFRGRATARRGHELVGAFTDDDAGPAITEEKPRKYRLDWSPHRLLLAADPPDDPVYFDVTDGAEAFYRKQAGIDLRVIQIGLTTGAPFEEWPPLRCEDEVRTCLQELGERHDTEACGYANEVEACFGVTDAPVGANEELFRRDLADEIVRWYDRHAADLRVRGARSKDAALAALESAPIRRMSTLEHGESFAFDLEAFDVFYVADPVFPDSERVWYGVYEPSGIVHRIYAVN